VKSRRINSACLHGKGPLQSYEISRNFADWRWFTSRLPWFPLHHEAVIGRYVLFTLN
jgi:hypothetical protein